ncbi:MAG: methyltransferase regulatory domain-containing protein, partial [Acetobacteraceae bacterium]
MANWDDGYVTDVVYTSNFYRETTPVWLATASMLLGHRPPDLTRPFRYADLGCAHGFTALTVAATCPHAEVWGFDFNPAHVESARNLAVRAGLTNAHFEEASFAQLATMAKSALPEFDFMVSHGVLSWISPENQKALISVIGQRLRPGGIAYISYNVTTGWAGMVPLRALMRMLTEASPERTDLSVPATLDFLDKMKAAGSLFFNAYPGIESRLRDVRQQDARYIAHEFLNRDWHPLMFADVADAMADVKCSYVGSATLSENIDAVAVPPNMAPMLAEARDLRLRETLRDFGAGQGFRRDIYRRGLAPIPIAEHQAMLNDLSLAWTGMTAGDQVTIGTPMGSLTGRPELYRPLLAMLEAGPLRVGHAHSVPPFAGRPLLELLQAVTLLVAGGYAHPMMPGGESQAARDGATRLNLAIAELNGSGGDMPRLCLPATGSAMNVDLLETLAIGEILAGRSGDAASMAEAVQTALARSGRAVQRDGQAVTDPGEARRIVVDALYNIMERRVP